jgi:hypothetical protein
VICLRVVERPIDDSQIRDVRALFIASHRHEYCGSPRQPFCQFLWLGDLDLANIVNPVRKLLKRVSFFAGDVESIDLVQRVVSVSHGFDDHQHELPYDHLIIGLGSITNFFNLPGLESVRLPQMLSALATSPILVIAVDAVIEMTDENLDGGILARSFGRGSVIEEALRAWAQKR